MKLVRFHARAFFDGTLVEQGAEKLVAEDTVLGAHMEDVRTGQRGPSPATLAPVFRADLAAHAATPIAQAVGPRTVAERLVESAEDELGRLEAEAKEAWERWNAAFQRIAAASALGAPEDGAAVAAPDTEEHAEPATGELTADQLAEIQAAAEAAVADPVPMGTTAPDATLSQAPETVAPPE